MVLDVSETLINALVTFLSVFVSFSLALWWDRRKDRKAREESLSQLKSSLKSELETNLVALREDSYRIREEGFVIDVRLLREANWKLIAGREDLKYLSLSSLAKIADAYVAIIDFNNILSHWKSVALLGKDRYVEYPRGKRVDLRPLVNAKLQEESKKAIATIEKAIEICSPQ